MARRILGLTGSNSTLTVLRRVTNPNDMVQIQITNRTLRRLKDNCRRFDNDEDITIYEEMINKLLDLFEQIKK